MKYSLFIKTDDSPIPRLCDFVVIDDCILGYHLRSQYIDLWIRKGTLKRAVTENLAITPADCEIYYERSEK